MRGKEKQKNMRERWCSRMKQHAQRERIIQHIQKHLGIEPDNPWKSYPNCAAFRLPTSRKWFAIIMEIPRNRLGLNGYENVDVIDLKCGSTMVGSLLAQDGFLPAYYMSKGTWISVLLDGTVPDEQIIPLVELSYNNMTPKDKSPGQR